MKTGYTNAAGYCLVASGERNGKRRIVVVLNDTEGGVWRDAQSLAGLGIEGLDYSMINGPIPIPGSFTK
jgi:D-alanyl-D-alanine carboxypeptidase